ncbi:MAG: DNA repair protein RecN [Sandaracinaceae bacterium]|nr:DNA repair protein RecN [Sandaracinaceae bacterium]MDW8247200.1 DNA repair protein RecN [Sandaracinaceae bacterium]
MLVLLRVRNFAIIDALEVEFGPGMNVITGETGAGKSVLINALGLVLGAKANNDLIRSGAAQAEVEALFEVRDSEAAAQELARAGIEASPETGSEILIRRITSQGGRSRAYVNGQLVTLSQLAELAKGLVQISSQHENHTLSDPKTHLHHLDAFGGIESETAQMGELFRALERIQNAIRETENRIRNRAERAELLSHQLSEISKINPRPGEFRELITEKERLRHAERLLRAASRSEEVLYSGDESISEALGRAIAWLREALPFEPRFESMIAALESAESQISEVGRELGRYARSLRLDPERLNEIEERMSDLERLFRKHLGRNWQDQANPEEELLARAREIHKELEALERAEEEIESLHQHKKQLMEQAAECARKLSEKRKQAACLFSERITRELRSLGMPSALLLVQVQPTEAAKDGEIGVGGRRLLPTGIDRAEILFAPNPGEEPRPLHRIASGGELSRVLLAIKVVLSQAQTKPGSRRLQVFDEIDTGVGGAVAEAVGAKLREVAQKDQVLCITHLAPVAVHGDRHFRVQKKIIDGKTRTEIRSLNPEERVEEIARMIGGMTITPKTIEFAKEMLEMIHR